MQLFAIEATMSDDRTERGIARRRVHARMGLVMHATIYVASNAAMVAIWALSGVSYPWFVWPLVGWGIGVIAHAFSYWFGPNSLAEAHAIERELERLRHAG